MIGYSSAFEDAMEQMASDPAIRTECAAIGRDFSTAEADGLTSDYPWSDLFYVNPAS